jgi:hypothetical protein
MTVEVHAPSMAVLVVSLLLALIALIGIFVAIPVITPIAFWLAFIAYVILALGTMVKTG